MINLEVLKKDIKSALAENDTKYATNLYAILKLSVKPKEFKQLEGLDTALLLAYYKAIHRFDSLRGIISEIQYKRLIELFVSDLQNVVKHYNVNIANIDTKSFSLLFNYKDNLDSGLYNLPDGYIVYLEVLETVILDYCKAFNIPFKHLNISGVCNSLYMKYIIQV